MPNDDDPIPILLEHIDAEQLRLRHALEQIDEPSISERPATGAWSVLENVRHLLFAEQLHLGRFIPGGQTWDPLSYTPQTMREARKLPPMDNAALPNIDDVLAAWDTVHAVTTREFAKATTADVQRALWRNLRHLRAHIGVVERLARRAARPGTLNADERPHRLTRSGDGTRRA